MLRALKYKEQFVKVSRFIPRSAIDKRTKAVADDIAKYFKAHEDETQLNMPAFRSLFFTLYHKGMKAEQCDFYNQLLTKMEEDNPDSVSKSLINQLLELGFATDIGNLVNDYEAEEDVDIITEVTKVCEAVREALERTSAFEFADIDDTTIGEESADDGMRWHLECLNNHYRNIMGGDQYIIAARPGLGKTTFLTHLNYAIAQGMPDNKVIIWFNNESRRQRIMSRQVQSALNMTDTELAKLKEEGTLTGKYTEIMGRKDRVRVYDIHGKNYQQLEEIVEAVGIENIGAIVCDMLDNVKSVGNKDQREDQRLEDLYKWLRELGVRCNCPTFPTSQVSADGDGLMYPVEAMLKDSKTGKQGACDGIIIVGWDHDPLHEHTRGISMPKTKTKREGQPNMREEIILDGDRGRYKG